IGTPAEVPILAKALRADETSEMARYALEAIPGDESPAALRAALPELEGPALVGVVHSLGARGDTQSVPALKTLAEHRDGQVAQAAVRALGNIADAPSATFLMETAERSGTPTPQVLAVALLRCADALAAAGKVEQAEAVYRRISEEGQPLGIRAAALDALFTAQETPLAETVAQWLAAADAARRRVAARRLDALSDAQLDALLDRLPALDEEAQAVLLQFSVARRAGELFEVAAELAKNEDERMRTLGLRILGETGEPSAIPLLVDALGGGESVADAARDALVKLPRAEVGSALLAALEERPALRAGVIDVLGRMTYYEAIDPLIKLAEADDPETYTLALQGLRTIADPDRHDIPRLVTLLLRSRPGRHADEVERTIVIVCEKLPAGVGRAELVLQSLRDVPESDVPKYLPLLGRLGGAEARRRIDAGLAHADPAVREAAVRALCNWPDAAVADRLLAMARDDENRTYRRWALRAFVRVVSLKSDRPEADTLAMLQEAMRLAEQDEDRGLVLERAGNVRTMEAVEWIASYLDNPALAQAACRALVELAHHRFLRHPNMDRFRPILKRVAAIAADPSVAERASRYEQGL
ncbi:MAG: HEAT repeat domain-containing protein, partial [Thermoguttaceae bacterium]